MKMKHFDGNRILACPKCGFERRIEDWPDFTPSSDDKLNQIPEGEKATLCIKCFTIFLNKD